MTPEDKASINECIQSKADIYFNTAYSRTFGDYFIVGSDDFLPSLTYVNTIGGSPTFFRTTDVNNDGDKVISLQIGDTFNYFTFTVCSTFIDPTGVPITTPVDYYFKLQVLDLATDNILCEGVVQGNGIDCNIKNTVPVDLTGVDKVYFKVNNSMGDDSLLLSGIPKVSFFGIYQGISPLALGALHTATIPTATAIPPYQLFNSTIWSFIKKPNLIP